MKKLRANAKVRDILRSFDHRKGQKKHRKKELFVYLEDSQGAKNRKSFLSREKYQGLRYEILKNKAVILYLPEVMNFSDNYDETVQHISAIRSLSGKYGFSNKAYRLASVNFDMLKRISTSAALVLTAELSKWDDIARQRLRPIVDNWDPAILQQLTELGFFDLFTNSQKKPDSHELDTELKLVKYIKGRCGDSKKARILRNSVCEIIGEEVEKWIFLRTGLDEAVTNVSHQ